MFGVFAIAAATSPATAAVIYRITLEPAVPRVGEPVVISVATYEADSPTDGSDLEPLPLAAFPWTFVADSPALRTHPIALERQGESGHRWTGTFVFPEAGRWEVGLDRRHLGTPPDPLLGARLEVSVGRMYPEPTVLVLVASLTILLAVALVLIRRRLSTQRS